MEWNRIKEWAGVFAFWCVWEFIKEAMKREKMVVPLLDTSLLFVSFKNGGKMKIFTFFNKGNQSFHPPSD
jgi:hypothetical protein